MIGRRTVRRTRVRRERGFTLMELMISITLVAALSIGMLMAIRSSLVAMNRINVRLEANRRVLGLQQIVSRQIGGAIPLAGPCALQGGVQMLRVVTTYSVNEGARGFPHVVIFRVLPDPLGGSQLLEEEFPYTGAGGCQGGPGVPIQPLVLASQLAGVRFSYHQAQRPNAAANAAGPATWRDTWNDQVLPSAIRLDTAPVHGLTSNLPSLSVNVVLHVNRQPGVQYLDIIEP
jgi:prepilin-type N-terminal cleavage/methylation domain-containing protein